MSSDARTLFAEVVRDFSALTLWLRCLVRAGVWLSTIAGVLVEGGSDWRTIRGWSWKSSKIQ